MGASDRRLVGDPTPPAFGPDAARRFLLAQAGRVLAPGECAEVVDGIAAACAHFGVAFDVAFAQAMVETNNGRFGGQVAVGQRNIGGIGATDDGAAGVSNATWAQAGWVFVAHILAWAGDPRGVESPRYALVVQKAARVGFAATWRELAGRWASDPGYGDAIDRRHDEIAGGAMVRVALAAGHRNTSGGDAFEREQTAAITPALARQCRALGMDVRVAQPDDGAGMFRGGLDAVGNAVVKWADAGWEPDFFVEVHTEGGGGSGVFCIYPDWGDDVDADVRDRLGPAIARRVAAATGLPVRRSTGEGVMSERATGVGLQGFRLGIFRTTAPLKASCTRLIVEYGAHDREPDLTIAGQPDFAERCALATAEALAEFAGIDLAHLTRPESYDATTGHYVGEPLLGFYRLLGGVAVVGHPLGGMVAYSDGALRQPFEYMTLGYYPATQLAKIESVGAALAAQTGSPYPVWDGIAPLL